MLGFGVRTMYDWLNDFKVYVYNCLLFLAMYANCMYSKKVSHNNSLTYLMFANIITCICAVSVIYLVMGIRLGKSGTTSIISTRGWCSPVICPYRIWWGYSRCYSPLPSPCTTNISQSCPWVIFTPVLNT